jgi:multidrug transporter EmrE-like cation transporter
MSFPLFLLTLTTVIGLSVGQILFKLAAEAMNGVGPFWLSIARNGYLLGALVVYGLSTALWIAVLRQAPLRLAYPFVAIAFVLVPIMGHWFLGEPLRWQTFVGAGLIGAGIWISVGTE